MINTKTCHFLYFFFSSEVNQTSCLDTKQITINPIRVNIVSGQLNKIYEIHNIESSHETDK